MASTTDRILVGSVAVMTGSVSIGLWACSLWLLLNAPPIICLIVLVTIPAAVALGTIAYCSGREAVTGRVL